MKLKLFLLCGLMTSTIYGAAKKKMLTDNSFLPISAPTQEANDIIARAPCLINRLQKSITVILGAYQRDGSILTFTDTIKAGTKIPIYNASNSNFFIQCFRIDGAETEYPEIICKVLTQRLKIANMDGAEDVTIVEADDKKIFSDMMVLTQRLKILYIDGAEDVTIVEADDKKIFSHMICCKSYSYSFNLRR